MDPKEYLILSDRTCKHIDEEGLMVGSRSYDLLHAAIGISGEAGEFLDAVKKNFFYNKEFDLVNAREELGDLLWYISLALRTIGANFDEIMQENIDKLALRYPDKYTDQAAQYRADKK